MAFGAKSSHYERCCCVWHCHITGSSTQSSDEPGLGYLHLVRILHCYNSLSLSLSHRMAYKLSATKYPMMHSEVQVLSYKSLIWGQLDTTPSPPVMRMPLLVLHHQSTASCPPNISGCWFPLSAKACHHHLEAWQSQEVLTVCLFVWYTNHPMYSIAASFSYIAAPLQPLQNMIQYKIGIFCITWII